MKIEINASVDTKDSNKFAVCLYCLRRLSRKSFWNSFLIECRLKSFGDVFGAVNY